ncbi:hypothetical protein ADUPG1_012740 [Aduncisulcus paluster]|uniref:non-specific serine/threonine protein kinase n=1 Tax=Aduncisulcus paluster TaxID=2918883 RepID=A0ABQ5K5B3_9EUKA|nr:hypothetical protein ADUPG1_012740 [Aduncisulcus paluster]
MPTDSKAKKDEKFIPINIIRVRDTQIPVGHSTCISLDIRKTRAKVDSAGNFSDGAKKMLLGEGSIPLDHLSVTFTSQCNVKGMYFNLSSPDGKKYKSAIHLTLFLTHLNGKQTILKGKTEGIGSYYAPIDFYEVTTCCISCVDRSEKIINPVMSFVRKKQKAPFLIKSLCFVREETPEELEFEHAKKIAPKCDLEQIKEATKLGTEADRAFISPIPPDYRNVPYNLDRISAKNEKFRIESQHYDVSSRIRSRFIGKLEFQQQFTHFSLAFTSPQRIDGVYLCVQSQKSKFGLFVSTTDKFKNRKVVTFKSKALSSASWLYIPLHLIDVIRFEIESSHPGSLCPTLDSLLFVRKETETEAEFRRIESSPTLIHPTLICKKKDYSEACYKDLSRIQLYTSGAKGVDARWNSFSKRYDASTEVLEMITSTKSVSFSHITIPFPNPSSLKCVHICVDKYVGPPSLLVVLSLANNQKRAFQLKLKRYGDQQEWYSFTLDVPDVVQCEIKHIQGMWKNMECGYSCIEGLVFFSPPQLFSSKLKKQEKMKMFEEAEKKERDMEINKNGMWKNMECGYSCIEGLVFFSPPQLFSSKLKKQEKMKMFEEAEKKERDLEKSEEAEEKESEKDTEKESEEESEEEHKKLQERKRRGSSKTKQRDSSIPKQSRRRRERKLQLLEESVLTSAENIEPLCIIGSGGFGKVFLVRVTFSGREPLLCALKCMKNQEMCEDNVKYISGMKKEFSRQCRLYSHHSIKCCIPRPLFILDLLDSNHEGILGILMEFCQGGCIIDFAKSWAIDLDECDPFEDDEEDLVYDPLKIASLCFGIIRCVSDVFIVKKKLVHRDIKPANFLVRYIESSRQCEIVLGDLGFVELRDSMSRNSSFQTIGPRRKDSSSSSQIHRRFSYKPSIVGTLCYNAPESLKNGYYCQRSDAWGVILSIWSLFNEMKEPFMSHPDITSIGPSADYSRYIRIALQRLIAEGALPAITDSELFMELDEIQAYRLKRMKISEARELIDKLDPDLLPPIGEGWIIPSIKDYIKEQIEEYGEVEEDHLFRQLDPDGSEEEEEE